MRKKKEVSELKDGANNSVENLTEKPIAISSCEQEWINKIGSRSKFISSEARELSKSNYIANCSK
jgi:hypothetical protein